ncbi:MAG: hypothetical protein RLZZ437_1573 [Pseudomonadota bacterium]|jgi:uncharacterized protein (DUF1501 family)
MMNRRFLLRSLGGIACSAAAHPFLSTVTLAQSNGAAPLGDHRLIVVILRGAMDGLDAVQPVGDADFARLRPTLAGGGLDLDGFFALHPELGGLMPLWQTGGLGFVHATSTPYRDKRSHFDGQDLLEAGTGMDVPLGALRDGWLNRMLQAVPGLSAETAYAVGREAQPMLDGPADARLWTPDVTLDLSAQSRLLLEHVYHDDDLFREAATEAMELAAMGMPEDGMAEGGNARLADIDTLVDFASARLLAETRIAAFSLSGWDTHRRQRAAIPNSFRRLQHLILQLQAGLGADVWGKTVLLAMTEFGRTVAENGSAGTDHGTGGVMLVAGGAVRGQRVMGQWPGLAEANLYDRRDLMPTSDVRAWAAWAMRGMFGFDRALLEGTVFPGLQMGDDPGLLL